jgi:hypothetical protein
VDTPAAVFLIIAAVSGGDVTLGPVVDAVVDARGWETSGRSRELVKAPGPMLKGLRSQPETQIQQR